MKTLKFHHFHRLSFALFFTTRVGNVFPGVCLSTGRILPGLLSFAEGVYPPVRFEAEGEPQSGLYLEVPPRQDRRYPHLTGQGTPTLPATRIGGTPPWHATPWVVCPLQSRWRNFLLSTWFLFKVLAKTSLDCKQESPPARPKKVVRTAHGVASLALLWLRTYCLPFLDCTPFLSSGKPPILSGSTLCLSGGSRGYGVGVVVRCPLSCLEGILSGLGYPRTWIRTLNSP